VDNFDRNVSLREYWKERMRLHANDKYRGRALVKMPEDLRTYQRTIEGTLPDLVIELGTFQGGSALWFADQIDTFLSGSTRPTVITIDIERHGEPIEDERVMQITGDLRSPDVLRRVSEVAADRRVMVVEDSAHVFDVTMASLRMYGPLVTQGCFMVVEDGVIDEPDLTIWDNAGGVQPAIEKFLEEEEGLRFVRMWLAPFGLTMHFGGWLLAGGNS
jgi:cephalosporin hydroxylase